MNKKFNLKTTAILDNYILEPGDTIVVERPQNALVEYLSKNRFLVKRKFNINNQISLSPGDVFRVYPKQEIPE